LNRLPEDVSEGSATLLEAARRLCLGDKAAFRALDSKERFLESVERCDLAVNDHQHGQECRSINGITSANFHFNAHSGSKYVRWKGASSGGTEHAADRAAARKGGCQC